MSVPDDVDIHRFADGDDAVDAANISGDQFFAQNGRVNAEVSDCLEFFRNHGAEFPNILQTVFKEISAFAAVVDDVGRQGFDLLPIQQVAVAGEVFRIVVADSFGAEQRVFVDGNGVLQSVFRFGNRKRRVPELFPRFIAVVLP